MKAQNVVIGGVVAIGGYFLWQGLRTARAAGNVQMTITGVGNLRISGGEIIGYARAEFANPVNVPIQVNMIALKAYALGNKEIGRILIADSISNEVKQMLLIPGNGIKTMQLPVRIPIWQLVAAIGGNILGRVEATKRAVALLDINQLGAVGYRPSLEKALSSLTWPQLEGYMGMLVNEMQGLGIIASGGDWKSLIPREIALRGSLKANGFMADVNETVTVA